MCVGVDVGFRVGGDPATRTGDNDAGMLYRNTGDASFGCSDGASSVFMTEALFLVPECFDDEDVMDEVSRYIDDPDIIFVAGDLAEDLEFLEDEAVSQRTGSGTNLKFIF